ncbi:MAG: hypothetical protein IJ072_03385, partial [Oscillospiraceae bacterium]|nr:hypothetical protein [Oscillospiraceae bacterium]
PGSAGYGYENYSVRAFMNDQQVEYTVTEEGGNWVIYVENAQGNVVFEFTKQEAPAFEAEVSEYVKIDDAKAIYLVTVAGEPEGGNYSYDGEAMFYSEKYGTYAYLVVSDTVLTKEEAAQKVADSTAEVVSITYDGDVNGTNLVDINDAQLVYDMYNAKYNSFETVSMLKFLRADLNGSKNLTTEDAAAVVNLIP